MMFVKTTTVAELPEVAYELTNLYNKWYSDEEFYENFCEETGYDHRDYMDEFYP